MTRFSRLLLCSLAILIAACIPKKPPAEGATQTAAASPASAPPQPTAIPAMPVTPATTPAAPAVNPFEGAVMFVNPKYAAKVESTIKAVPEIAPPASKVKNVPTALWLDSIAAVASVPEWLEEVAQQEKKAAGKPVVPVFVVYDLPNRDCSAKASAGELTSENDGEQRYRTEFIDKIAEHFSKNPKQRIVAILEPDSLPNVATNLGVPKCKQSENLYRNSIAYAISKLSLPNVHLYMDAAHAGWLGWEGNRQAISKIFKEVLTAAGGPDRIRGFATNVSNFNVLKGDDGKKLEPSNPCPDEITYVQKLNETLTAHGIANKGFIIDTSRNGKGGIRSKWGNWCNIKGAGIGERPRVAPEPLLDAYFWVKPPGESDGTADSTAARFDENCRSDNAAPGAPEAGQWFEPYFVELLKNANPPL